MQRTVAPSGASSGGGVSRALALLALFDREGQELRVTEVATGLGIHKSTASRLAATLELSGFLERVEAGRGFRLGPVVARLGVLALGGRGWAEVARPVLAALAETTGETVFLSVPAGSDAYDVVQENARRLLGATSWVGLRTPLHATSDGKAMLAFGAGTLQSGALARVARGTITSRKALASELEEIRRRGYATAAGEIEDGLHGAAAPVFAGDGRCVAAISASGPSNRLPQEDLPALARQCIEAALEVEARLGWNGRGQEAA